MGLDYLTLHCRANGLPEPELEVRFHPRRRWRLDYVWRPAMLVVEQEGAVWTQGRHTRGSGFIKDMEKYNAATLEGFRILRFTPQQIQSGACVPVLRTALVRYWPDGSVIA